MNRGIGPGAEGHRGGRTAVQSPGSASARWRNAVPSCTVSCMKAGL